MGESKQTRREFIKRASYMAPVILTLPAVLSVASAGSPPPPGPEGGAGGRDHDRSCDWYEFWCWMFR